MVVSSRKAGPKKSEVSNTSPPTYLKRLGDALYLRSEKEVQIKFCVHCSNLLNKYMCLCGFHCSKSSIYTFCYLLLYEV